MHRSHHVLHHILLHRFHYCPQRSFALHATTGGHWIAIFEDLRRLSSFSSFALCALGFLLHHLITYKISLGFQLQFVSTLLSVIEGHIGLSVCDILLLEVPTCCIVFHNVFHHYLLHRFHHCSFGSLALHASTGELCRHSCKSFG